MGKPFNSCILLVVVFLDVALTLKAQTYNNPQLKSNLHNFDSYKGTGYNQTLRPQFHFTSLKNWINDPNGLVWYDGEYHLYFQHNPTNIKWEPGLVWGHAVSTDMVHWEQLTHAIYPPIGSGGVYSGTAVVDHNNTLRKQKGNVKTLVAYFTAKGGQCGAYSADKGRTYQLLNDGDPLVMTDYKGARDPKIFWHEASKRWIMVLWVQKAENEGTPDEKQGIVRFYNSKNLIDWNLTSELNRNWAYECMDFVELTVDGNTNNKKWLLYDASFDYEVGYFDGKSFTSDKKSYLGDYGPKNFYAGQTFSNSPDNRTVMIGWMNGGGIFQKAEMPFSQQMSFPNTLELKTTPEGIRLYRWPIKEIEKLYSKNYKFDNLSLEKANEKLTEIKAELIDLSVEFESKNPLKISIRGLDVIYDNKTDSISFGKTRISAPAFQNRVSLRILLDRASIELFINNGASVATFYAIPKVENQRVILSGENGTKINSLIINELKSIWGQLK
jgi:sucrose-6-phosphate hydrolase SacC (GH32 family)